MNKYLLMSATAALAATAGSGVAQASTTVHLNSYCDYFVFTNAGGGLWAAKHVGAIACATNTFDEDAGVQGPKKSKVPGKKGGKGTANMADAIFDALGDGTNGSEWVFSTPFATSGTWAFVVTFTGSTAFVGNSGNQSKAHPGATKTAVADLVKAMRSK